MLFYYKTLRRRSTPRQKRRNLGYPFDPEGISISARAAPVHYHATKRGWKNNSVAMPKVACLVDEAMEEIEYILYLQTAKLARTVGG